MGCSGSKGAADASGAPSSTKAPLSFKAKYKMGAKIGEGAYSKVYEAILKSDNKTRVAVKVVHKQPEKPKDDELLRQEVDILRSLEHPNIVRCFDFYEDDKEFYVVMEMLEGGEVFDRLVKKTYYSELEARELILVLLNAIKYCHDRSIVHRDLKCENLLLVTKDDDHMGSIKVADFGFAVKCKGLELRTQCGTPGYVAPEIIKKEPYGAPCDMWSIGVILYILLGGYPPFHEKTQKLLFQKIKSGEFEFHRDYWKDVSSEAKNLISGLLKVDAKKRLTVDMALKHPWILKAASELQSRNLDANLKALRKYNLRRKFMAVVRLVIAGQRMTRLIGSIRAAAGPTPLINPNSAGISVSSSAMSAEAANKLFATAEKVAVGAALESVSSPTTTSVKAKKSVKKKAAKVEGGNSV